MNLSREEKIKILEYKLAFEELIQIEKEFEDGASDLNFRLSFFQKKLDTSITKNGVSQTSRYNEVVWGRQNSNDKDDSNSIAEASDLNQNEFSKSANVKPWAKKLYRKIAVTTHPDKIQNLTSDSLKEKLEEQYLIATQAYEEEIYSDLIMIAYDLNIGIPEGRVFQEVHPALMSKSISINNIKKKIAWQWYHVPDDQKDAELKKILVNMGFVFTDKQVEEAINSKYIKRKPGERPVNRFKNRLNKKM